MLLCCVCEQFERGVLETAVSLLDVAKLRSMSRHSALAVVHTIARMVSVHINVTSQCPRCRTHHCQDGQCTHQCHVTVPSLSYTPLPGWSVYTSMSRHSALAVVHTIARMVSVHTSPLARPMKAAWHPRPRCIPSTDPSFPFHEFPIF